MRPTHPAHQRRRTTRRQPGSRHASATNNYVSVRRQQVGSRDVDGQPARLMRLGVLLDHLTTDLDDGAIDQHLTVSKVDRRPAQRDELTPSGASDRSHVEEQTELGVARSLRRLNQGDDHLRARRIEARPPNRRRSGPVGDVLADPSPSHGLVQRRAEHSVHGSHRRRRQSFRRQRPVNAVEMGGVQLVQLRAPNAGTSRCSVIRR